MRHSASMVASMEGVGRPVYRIAWELSQNSRSGLTTRFLAKKLEVPEEEVEYLVDVNHHLLFTDLTKIKLASEGHSAVKRISEGLENLGDVTSLFRKVKSLAPHDFRRLEDIADLSRPGAKKAVAECLVEKYYKHPDSVVEYVASSGFSATAREVFDIVWLSKDGIMPADKIRRAHGGSEYDVEQALWELFRGVALFEMFRFDAEDRLVRVAGLLSEIRQLRDQTAKLRRKKTTLKGTKNSPAHPENLQLRFTDAICQLVAAVAAKPARVRGDGELFREDRRRLSEVIPEDSEPTLGTCLWAAEGVGWLGRVDNEVHAGELENLISVDRFSRHKMVFEWMTSKGPESASRRVLGALLDAMKPKVWYSSMDVIDYAVHVHEEREQPLLKAVGGHHRYVSPSAAVNMDRQLARSLEESLFWLGVVEKGADGAVTYFRVTELGRCLLTGKEESKLRKDYRKSRSELIVQPNFDVVVPTRDMDPLLTVPLDQFAVRQSSGQASVYHLSKDSFTQSLQNGHDGDAFVEFLVAHNRGEVPANVLTTLDDWRGGVRRVRLRTLHVLETDDTLVMAELQHRRKLKKYLKALDSGRIAAYGKISKGELTKLLEKDGFIVN